MDRRFHDVVRSDVVVAWQREPGSLHCDPGKHYKLNLIHFIPFATLQSHYRSVVKITMCKIPFIGNFK